MKPPPTTMRTMENWNEAIPDTQFDSQMRPNHDTAPYNVRTGCYLPRHGVSDRGTFPTLRTKRSFAVGELTAAPWRHAAHSIPQPEDPDYEARYMSNKDFDRYRRPPRSMAREDFIEKNATREAIRNKDGSLWENPYDMKA